MQQKRNRPELRALENRCCMLCTEGFYFTGQSTGWEAANITDWTILGEAVRVSFLNRNEEDWSRLARQMPQSIDCNSTSLPDV
mmetsp:Transcript_3578/g.7249  ORF Transcript_3578/g.7249 Transcript_3578/m.7249 type:complete len:83 (-) Transcript_3578:128-376(-)